MSRIVAIGGHYGFEPSAYAATAKDDDDKPGFNGDDDDEGTSVRVGAGVLFGLNENTSDYALKWSVEIEF